MSVPALMFLFSTSILAQVPGPPGSCFGFNDTLTPNGWIVPVPVTGFLEFRFTAPSAVTVERFELVLWPDGGLSMRADFHPIDAVIGSPLGPPAASGYSGLSSAAIGWVPMNLDRALSLAAGSTYLVRLTATPFNQISTSYASAYLPFATGPLSVALPYVMSCPSGPCMTYPASGTAAFLFRFRSQSCGAGTFASVSSVGTACGIPGVWGFGLGSSRLPVLGTTNWIISMSDAGFGYGAPVLLYWSVGVDPVGTPLTPGSACRVHLDITSLLSLFHLGAEPVAISTVAGPGGIWIWPVTTNITVALPSDPLLAGTVLGVQGVVLTPAGVPFGTSGFTGALTNTLRVVLGY